MTNLLNTKAATYGAVAIVGAVALYLVARQLAGAVPGAVRAVGEAVNPLDPDNLAHRAVTAVGQATSGDTDWTLGGWFYDLTHEEYDPNATTQPVQPPTTRQASAWDSFWAATKDIFTP